MIEQQYLNLVFETAHPRLISVAEIFSASDAKLLRLIQEDRRVERKAAGIHAKSVGEYISMWANTPSDGGIIAIGISNDGKIDGTLVVSQNHMNDLERAGDVFAPMARYETKLVPAKNSEGARDQILLIRVHYSSDKVVRTTEGHAFLRRGESKKRLSEDEIRELQADRGEVSTETQDSRLQYPQDFNTDLIVRFANSVIRKRNLENIKSNEEILEITRLGRFQHRSFVPNIACVLLFAKDPVREIPGSRIRFLRFEGTQEGFGEKFNAVKDIYIEGPVPEIILKAEQVLEGQLREFSALGKDGAFYSQPEYPKLAWYEAIVNACSHRSYSLRTSPIFIKMFDDRLVVESPGGFPPLVTAQNIYDQHRARNPFLMDGLFALDFVKCAHEGTRRMRQTMADNNLPAPDFREETETQSLVKVTLRNNVEQRKVWLDADLSGIIGEKIFNTLSSFEKRVLNVVAENEFVGVSQVQRLTGKSWPASKKLLDALVSKGMLFHQKRQNLNRDPKARYYLNPHWK